MSHTLQSLLVIYSLILLANSAFSFYLWKVYKDDLYKISVNIWLSSLFNFLLQGFFQNSDLRMLFSFSTYGFTSYFLYKFTLHALEDSPDETPRAENRELWIFSSLGLVVASYLMFMSGLHYQVAAAVCAVGIVVPMLRSAYLIWKCESRSMKSIKVMGLVFVVNSLHFLDYPILRFTESGALVGFSIALSILFILSIFIPLFISDKNSRLYSTRLETEVVSKTKELSLISEDHKNFLIMVCHDLSSLLSISKYHSDKLVRNTLMDATAKDLSLAKMNQCINSSISILLKVKELQSLKAGKEKFQLEPINLHNCLLDTVNMYSVFLKNKNLKVDIETNNISPMVYGDQILMVHQVFGNLISNAAKFSENDGRIHVQFYEKEGFVGVSIKDSGIGMPEEIARNLFSFTSRTTRPGTSNEKGTGFGMPLVKTCVDLMGGHIRVQSQEKNQASGVSGCGSTFSIELKKAA